MRDRGRPALAAGGAVLALALAASVVAAPLRNAPVEVRTADGRLLSLFATGDEFHRRVHDAAGYTVIRDPATSRVVYATLQDGRLVPSRLEPGRDDPRSLRVAPGIDNAPDVVRAEVEAKRAAFPRPVRGAPNKGLINNLVLFVRFQDEEPLTTPTKTWEDMLDSGDPAVPSLRGYYQEASYGTLDIVSHLLPKPAGAVIASYQDRNPRSYYQKRDLLANPGGYLDEGDAMVREQQMVRRALEASIGDLPPGTNLDGDGDGFVDNLTVVVSGKPDGWSDLLWPHMSLQLADLIYLDELIVLTYNLQLNDYVLDHAGVGVLAHEMFHTLGGPDLYHYSYDKKTPAGPWDLMEWDQKVPQHMSLHQKVRYARWADPPPLITESGTYVVNPLTSPTGQGWRLPIPGQPKQFFQVEYRRKAGPYESSLPMSGLLIWRVDERWWGNNDGPPDELYVFRPGGTTTADGQVQQAPFSVESGRTSFGLDTDPAPFDQYGAAVGLRITDVSATGGDTMSFTVCMAYSTCFLKQCGSDGCGGTCGTCPAERLCEDGLCVAEQKCATRATCLAGCTDATCREACGIVPAVCPKPAACRDAGACSDDTGECTYPFAPEGTACDDHDACTLGDACRADGACAGSPDPACAVDDGPPDPGQDVPVADAMPEATQDVPGPDATGDAAPPADLPAADEDADAPADATGGDLRPADAPPDVAADTPADAVADLPPVTPNRASGGCVASPLPSPAALLPLLLAALALRRRRD